MLARGSRLKSSDLRPAAVKPALQRNRWERPALRRLVADSARTVGNTSAPTERANRSTLRRARTCRAQQTYSMQLKPRPLRVTHDSDPILASGTVRRKPKRPKASNPLSSHGPQRTDVREIVRRKRRRTDEDGVERCSSSATMNHRILLTPDHNIAPDAVVPIPLEP
jgi:hypothetical protein